MNRIQPVKTWSTGSPLQSWFTTLYICFTVVFLPTHLIFLFLAFQKLSIASENGIEGRGLQVLGLSADPVHQELALLVECTGCATATRGR